MLLTNDQKKVFRNACGRFATGVTIITAHDGMGKWVGLTANSFTSVSLEPPLVLWSLSRSAPSLAVFERASHFSISVLAEEQRVLSQQFASGQPEKFDGVALREGLHGLALVERAMAWFECESWATYEGGDHLIFVGKVERCAFRDGNPLVFFGGEYGSFSRVPTPV
jgi:flavin reductase (DIM6/NTAB) family NADH-FMN oxidoreductase RutF